MFDLEMVESKKALQSNRSALCDFILNFLALFIITATRHLPGHLNLMTNLII